MGSTCETKLDRTVGKTVDRVAHAENVKVRSREGELSGGKERIRGLGARAGVSLAKGRGLWQSDCDDPSGPASRTWDRPASAGAAGTHPFASARPHYGLRFTALDSSNSFRLATLPAWSQRPRRQRGGEMRARTARHCLREDVMARIAPLGS